MMKCYLKVYGCQMNVADSHLISRLLADAGIRQVKEVAQADAVVVLTCSVRQHAEDRAAGFARSMRGRGKKVILAGCMGRYRGVQLAEQGIADYVLGPDQYRMIPRILEREPADDHPNLSETYADILPCTSGSVSAQLPIMRGCNHSCTYCVVPLARGAERSIPYPAIERKARHLADKGTGEIFLLGQNVLAYRYQDMGLVEVLEELSGIKGLKRLGFLTSHPGHLTFDVLQRISHLPKVLSFFHLPLQSGSDRVLKMMRRGYTFSGYEEKVGWIRRLFAEPYITTDLMVGFPGEGEEDFRLTLDAAERIGFDFAYMFAYSPRPGTPAAEMDGQIPLPLRKRRLQILIERQNRIVKQRAEGLVGKEEEVFVRSPAPRGQGAMLANLANNRSVILNSTSGLGRILRARMVGVQGRSVLAEPVAKEAS